MALRRKRQPRRTGRFLLISLAILLLGSLGVAFFLFFEGSKPEIALDSIPDHIGRNSRFAIAVSDSGSGLRSVRVVAQQKDVTKELYNATNPRIRQTGQIGPLSDTQTIEFDAKKAGFTDGELTITVIAYDFSMRGMFKGNSTVATRTVTLDTQPPRLSILHSERYISPGGAGIAIYSINEVSGKHGVTINGDFHQGHPLGDGRDDVYISYFALSYDDTTIDELSISGSDIAGNSVTVPFSTTVKKVRFKQDRINVSDGFLSRKIPEFEQYYPDMRGTYVEKYLQANGRIRQENNAKITSLCANPLSERLWEGQFERMAGSNHAGFADHRTYFMAGKPIDKQVHLGMDIASTKRANVKAANTGKVVFADYLGIYGNMVLLDHGQGIFSLYSHLSQINVAVDDMVAKGDLLGLTGTSGMAGGDHLHFSMLVNGVFTTPVEWWDPHWIEVTIDEPIVSSKF